VLPSALVEHRAAYGILSKGLHELDEESCRQYFPAVRLTIVTILEQDLQAKKQKVANEDLKELARIGSQIKKSK